MPDSDTPETADHPRSKHRKPHDPRPKPGHEKAAKAHRGKDRKTRDGGSASGEPSHRKSHKRDRRKHGEHHAAHHAAHGGPIDAVMRTDAAERVHETVGEAIGGAARAGRAMPGGIGAILGVATLGLAGLVVAKLARGNAPGPRTGAIPRPAMAADADVTPLAIGETPEAVQTLRP